MRLTLPLALLFLSTGSFAQTAPTEVFWYDGNGGQPPGGEFTTTINGLGGTVVVDDVWPTTPLSDYRAVIIGRPGSPLTQDQIDDLSSFRNDDSGIVVIAADSLGAGANHITATNQLLDGLGVGMSLASKSVSAPVDNGVTQCVFADVISATPFLNLTTEPGVTNMGDIVLDDQGTAEIIANRDFFVDMVSTSFALMARNELTLLVADFDQFGDDICGISTKRALWGNIYGLYCDRDDDGFIANACGGFDCDDLDEAVGATFTYEDLDSDGIGSDIPSCEANAVTITGDCDDDDPDINPNADEICDTIDNDCDGRVDGDDTNATGLDMYWQDADGDGYGRAGTTPLLTCEEPIEGTFVQNDGDCNDGAAAVNPDAMELCGNNIDDNCNDEIDETCVTSPPIVTPPTTEPGCCSQSSTPVSPVLGLLGLLVAALRRRRV